MSLSHSPASRRPLRPAVPAPPRDVDQRVILNGISWRDYSVLRDLLDGPGLRMTYLEGTLELMSPSRLHEDVKTRIARLLELYALERELRLYGYGSTTFRLEPKERGLEPDECYTVGHPMKEYPDLAIEVVVTAGASTSSRSTAGSACARCGGGRTASSRCTCSRATRTSRTSGAR